MMTNDIYKIDEQGNRSYVCCYMGNHSAEYALYLHWCQNIQHCDYKNKANLRRFMQKRYIGESLRNVYIEGGTDVYCCQATKEHGYNVAIGDAGGKYDYEPNYPTK